MIYVVVLPNKKEHYVTEEFRAADKVQYFEKMAKQAISFQTEEKKGTKVYIEIYSLYGDTGDLIRNLEWSGEVEAGMTFDEYNKEKDRLYALIKNTHPKHVTYVASVWKLVHYSMETYDDDIEFLEKMCEGLANLDNPNHVWFDGKY